MSENTMAPFVVTGDSYDRFMGRYSPLLAEPFARWAGATPGTSALDAGCGTGALTAFLFDILGYGKVDAFDPSEAFVDACRKLLPGVDIRVGSLENVPFSGPYDLALAQLVLGLVNDPLPGVWAMQRVVRTGGRVAVNVWDSEGMSLLRHFADSCAAVAPGVPPTVKTLPLGQAGELLALFTEAGLAEPREIVLSVSSRYGGFDELWAGFGSGMGPASTYLATLDAAAHAAVRHELFGRLGSPEGNITLDAAARCCRGTVER